MVEALEERVADLQSLVRHLERVITDVDEAAILKEAQDDAVAYASEAVAWYDVACHLYDAVIDIQEQLSGRGIGIRPSAQQALHMFDELDAGEPDGED